MSNVDRLSQAGVVDRDALSPEQVHFINHELSADEVHHLISMRTKLHGYQVVHPSGFCTVTITF